MKKLFTLAICLFSLSAVFAQNYEQRGNDDQRRFNEERYSNQGPVIVERGYETDRPRFEIEGNDRMHRIIDRIRFRYDRRIERVQNNYFMDSWQKQRVIENLELQKHNEIREVYQRFHFEEGDRY